MLAQALDRKGNDGDVVKLTDDKYISNINHLHDFTLNSLVRSCEEYAAELKMVFFNSLVR